jgi:hypothetical protein
MHGHGINLPYFILFYFILFYFILFYFILFYFISAKSVYGSKLNPGKSCNDILAANKFA